MTAQTDSKRLDQLNRRKQEALDVAAKAEKEMKELIRRQALLKAKKNRKEQEHEKYLIGGMAKAVGMDYRLDGTLDLDLIMGVLARATKWISNTPNLVDEVRSEGSQIHQSRAAGNVKSAAAQGISQSKETT